MMRKQSGNKNHAFMNDKKAMHKQAKKVPLKAKIYLIEKSSNIEEILNFSYIPQVYEDSYFFVSYCHKDYKKVYKNLLYLEKKNINLWYDRGLAPGKDWLEVVQTAIYNHSCKGVILFISDDALNSESVLDEIKVINKSSKPVVSIFINQNLNFEKFLCSIKDKPSAHFLLELFNKNKNLMSNINEVKYQINLLKKIKKIPEIDYKELNNETTIEIEKANNFEIAKFSFSSRKNKELNSINETSFANCKKLENVNIKSKLLFIKDYAFYGCENLKEINIKGKIETVGLSAFEQCSSLIKIKSNKDNTVTLSEKAFSQCSKLTHLPFKLLDGNIPNGCFADCKKIKSLFDVVNRTNIRFIGVEAFKGCESIETLEVVNSIETILDRAFEGCTMLKSIHFYNNNVLLSTDVFSHCSSLFNIIVEDLDNLENILLNDAFKRTSLKEIWVKKSISENFSKKFNFKKKEDNTGSYDKFVYEAH